MYEVNKGFDVGVIYLFNLMFICNTFQEDDTEMDVDAAAPATQISIKHGLPEIEIYCYLLVLVFLIDQKKYAEVVLCH